MLQPDPSPRIAPLLSITVTADGRVQVGCGIPKLDAIKLLLGVVEDLRVQALREQSSLIQVVPPMSTAAV